MRSIIVILALLGTIQVLSSQLPIEQEPVRVCHTSLVNMEGIFSQERRSKVTDIINQVVRFHSMDPTYIQINSSGKILITGIDAEQSADQLRDALSQMDWEYLSELMTVEIVIGCDIEE